MKGIRKLFSSIIFRMLVLYIGIITVAFAAILLVSSDMVEEAILRGNISTKQIELTRISYELTDDIDKMNTDNIYNAIVGFAQSENGRVLVLNTDYVVVADSSSLFNGYYLPYEEAVNVLENSFSNSYGFHKLENVQTGAKEWMAYYAKPVSANGLNKGALLLSVSIQHSKDIVENARQKLLISIISTLIAITVLWIIIASNITRPVIQLTNVMKNATAKTFEKRVNIKAGGEMAELVAAFNRMGSELNAHDKIRDRFVADASHELKTPLASMKALSESIIYCDNPPPELMLDFLKDINEQVDRLNNIVQDLLTVARDSSMDVDYKMEKINFSKITTNLVEFITPVAEKKNLKLTVQTDPDIMIFGDKSRIERLVTNLVDNAIKYTEHGSISVKLKRERRDAVLTVKDTGIGIPEDSIPNLFVRFYRVDKARSRATGGTGLGLSIVEEIVNRHSGTISVNSKLGEGSEFIVRIPMT